MFFFAVSAKEPPTKPLNQCAFIQVVLTLHHGREDDELRLRRGVEFLRQIYETQSGHKVGIAVATERKPDRWFLSLLPEGFDHAVLLCKRETGDTVEICLPKNFFDEYGDKMSQSGNQMKFNVVRRGIGYAILVPGTGG